MFTSIREVLSRRFGKSSRRRSRHEVIEPLESRRLLSQLTITDIESPDDGLVDVIIREAANDLSSDVYVFVDPVYPRTVIWDDVNGNGVVNGALTIILPPPANTTVTYTTAANELYLLQFVPETINGDLKGGNDDLAVRLVHDLYDTGLSVYANMGSGNDTFQFGSPTSAGGPATAVNTALVANNIDPLSFDLDGADIILSDLLLDVDLGYGTDSVITNLARTSIIHSNVVLNLYGGAGPDTFNVALPNQPDFDEGILGPAFYAPSRLNVNIYTGGSSSDTSTNTINLDIQTELEDVSHVDINIEGDRGIDIINMNNANSFTAPLTLDTDPFTVFNFDANLYGGNDRVNALFDFSGELEIEVASLAHFGVSGGDGSDNIQFRNAADPGNVSTPIDGRLEFDLRGGNAADTIQLHFDSNVPEDDNYFLLGEFGEFAGLLYGDGGNDFLEIDNNFGPVSSGGLVDLAIYAGFGDDRAVMAVELTVNVTIVRLLLDGGGGYNDKYDLDPNDFASFGDTIIRGFEQEDDNLEPNEIYFW